MFFKISKKSKKSRARIGVIKTPHGAIQTPAFVPVGTQATVKGITIAQLKDIGAESLLCNTYHLYLRPSDVLIKKMGGLHKFMNWDGPIFTDSGGFQAFSLGYAIEHKVGKIASIFPGRVGPDSSKSKKDSGEQEHTAHYRDDKLAKITENGVEFRSHLDGSKHFFTPEKSMEIQRNLGADIIFAFDECTSPLHDYVYTKKSMERTHRWAVRCLEAHEGQQSNVKGQMLFGIVQGGAYKDLREASAKFIGAMDFPGFGIGGSLGKSKQDMYKVLNWSIPLLPENKPKHLLGIGSPEDIRECVKRGIDTFDCVMPTRLGRNGAALLNKGTLNIKSGRYLNDKNPIGKRCDCYTCENYSRSYVSHLFKANEMLGPILTTIHNLRFMENLMRQVREEIKKGQL